MRKRGQYLANVRIAYAYTLVIIFSYLVFHDSISNYPLILEITEKCLQLRKSFYEGNTWMINSSNDYFIQSEISSLICPNCGFTPSNWLGDSTTNDIIVTFCFGTPQSIPPFVRMLRTVKCKAKIVIIADNEAYTKIYKYSFASFFPICEVVVYNIGKLSIKLRFELYQMKTLVYREFLQYYYYKIDRIILCDLSDTAFQSDPFKFFMHEDSIYNYIENITIAEELETLSDIDYFFQDEISSNNYIVTPAVYMGHPLQALKLLDLIQSYFVDADGNRLDIVDQSITTYLFYTGKYKNWGINMKALNWTQGVISANLSPLTSYDIGNITSPDFKLPPFIVHHTNYMREILLSIYKTCPRLRRHKGEIYLGDLDRETMELIDAEYRQAFSQNRKIKYYQRKAKLENKTKP